jgi:hypothetical protein
MRQACPAGTSQSLITRIPATGVTHTVTPASIHNDHQEVYIMKPVRTLGAALVISALLVALSGCEKQEGPMEKAGQSIDNATESVGEHVENAGEAIQDAAKGDSK